MVSQEPAFLNTQTRLEKIRRYVEQAADSGERIDRVERELFAQLLELGAVYSINRFPRSAADVVDEIWRKQRAEHRPTPQNKQVTLDGRPLLPCRGQPRGRDVAEGACRHLVKDRMEETGMRWTVPGPRRCSTFEPSTSTAAGMSSSNTTPNLSKTGSPGRLRHRDVRVTPVDITASLDDPEFGADLGVRLRRLADCGFLVRKWEVYDASFWRGTYEWGTATGGRGLLLAPLGQRLPNCHWPT